VILPRDTLPVDATMRGGDVYIHAMFQILQHFYVYHRTLVLYL
jgi:hypothetical protein